MDKFILDPGGPRKVIVSNDVYSHLAYDEDFLDEENEQELRELMCKFPEGFELQEDEPKELANGKLEISIWEYIAALPRGNYKVLIPDETLALEIQTLPADENQPLVEGVLAEVWFVMPKQNRTFGKEQVTISLNSAHKPVVKLKSGTEIPVWGPRLIKQ